MWRSRFLRALLDRLQVVGRRGVLIGHAGVVLERLGRRHDHHRVGAEPARPADDVHELLHAQIRAEAGLGDQVVTQLLAGQVGDHRAVAVGDVAERADVHEARLALQRLDQVGLERILEQHRHRTRAAHLLGRDRCAVDVVADRDRTHPPPQILQRGGHAHDRHDLGGGNDVEAGLTRNPVSRAAQTGDDVSQVAIVHVDRSPPGHAVRRDPALVAVEDVAIDERRQHVVGRGHGVEVAGEVEVEILHRHDLGEPAAGRAALDAEDRPQRRLAQAQHRLLADRAQALRERHRRGRLALARLGRRDRRDTHDLGVGSALQSIDRAQADLGLVFTVEIDLVFLEPHLQGDIHDRSEDRFLRNLEA